MRRAHESMELQHLRAFVAISEAGGFGRAAARLNLSQPALSRQIHGLEAELGVRLFDRVGRRVQLTSEGEDLLQRTRRLLTEASSLGERARALKSGETGVLRVGATPQVIENVLARFLPRYRRCHPGVDVHLVEEGGTALHDCLERGEFHLGVMTAGDDRFRGHPLFPWACLAVMARGHRLSRRATVDIRELADEPVLLLRRGFGSRAAFDAACRIARIDPPLLLESAAPHSLIALARTGYGIAVIPSPVLPSTAQLQRSGARAVPIVQGKQAIGGWVGVAWDPRRFQAPYATRFVEELTAYVRHAYPGRGFVRLVPARPPASPASA
jgi:DNA-binding transcriptional LysR family regulator